MAQKVIKTYVDDLTGAESPDIASHSILIDGAGVEIDLTGDNYEELLKLLSRTSMPTAPAAFEAVHDRKGRPGKRTAAAGTTRRPSGPGRRRTGTRSASAVGCRPLFVRSTRRPAS